ncbi:MAG: phenylacetate--CoA ligase family protein [Desulfarculus sp.]|nr:MAG: phenylacetate--CoA ligase family protein [Desulfarculus sp.]
MPGQQRWGRFLNREAETKDWALRLPELEQRFLKTLRRAAARSQAYGDLYQQAGVDAQGIRGLADLARLPILRMSDLVRRQEQAPPFGGFETQPAERFPRIYVNPGFLWQPGESPHRDTSWAEALCAGGLLPGDRVLNTFSYHLWPYAHMLDESAQMLGATVVPGGTGNAFMQVRIMRKLAVKAYLGTPSFLMTLAQRAEAMGLDPAQDLSLEAAVVGAEMLSESLRLRLQEKLGISVRQAYGTVYLGCLGYECQQARGLHVPDGVLVEVVDPQTGRPQPPGTPGEVVASHLDPAYPMIRLATGDLSLWAQGSCPCGRSGPRLQRILGRIDQAVKVRGTFVHPWQIDEVFAARPEVFKYQAAVSRQQDQDLITLLVELREGVEPTPELRRQLEQELREFLTVKGEVEFLPQGTIPDFHGKIVDRRKWD